MKYPFTPEFLDAVPDNIVRIFRDLEIKLIEEICSRLAISGEANEVVLHSIRTLRERGIPQERIDRMIMKHVGLSEKELDRIYDDAAKRNQQFYTDLIGRAEITRPYKEFSLAAAAETVEAIRRQTKSQFENLTRTIAFQMRVGGRIQMITPGGAFYRILDDAEAQIRSGAISYNQAISEAVKQLAGNGVRVVEYASGHADHLDVAVRRAVMTGVSQICAKYTEISAAYLGTDRYEVSAHSGARDVSGRSPWSSHKAWQGKVYSTRSGDVYPNIYAVCGLGYVDGLEGANCRHRRWCWVDGVMERTYTDEQLEHIDDGLGCTFEGKQYTAYEATQKQRQIERTIRKKTRVRAACKAAGLMEDEQNASAYIRQLNGKYRAFSKAAHLPMQWERTRVLYQ